MKADHSESTTMIYSLTDLAEHVGANSPLPCAIDRRIYKDTRCGAHVSFLFPDKPARADEFLAEIRMDPATGRTCLHKLHPESSDVRLLLGFNADGSPSDNIDALANLDAFAKAAEELQVEFDKSGSWGGMSLTKIAKCVGCVRVTVKQDVMATGRWVHSGQNTPYDLDLRTCLAVQIGSIVEGSEVVVNADPLEFPFTAEEFDKVLQWVDDEACACWDEEHGGGEDEKDETAKDNPDGAKARD